MTLPALVLSAGFGTRLDPLTRIVAKPAVPLGNRSLIERVLHWLRQQGVHDAVLNLHHLPATITAIIGDGAHLGMSVRYSWEQPLLGSAGGPRRALPLLPSDPILIVNGDTLCDFDIGAMLTTHIETSADVTMAVVPNPAPDHYNGIVLDEAGVVLGFVPRGAAGRSWHFVGVQIAERRVFDGLADGVPAETVAGIYRDLIRTRPGAIRGWKPTTPFLDVGTPRDYLRAALLFSHGEDRTDRADAGSRVVRTICWPAVRLDAGVDLEDCVAIGDVHLPSGFRARSAVLAPAAIARRGDRAIVRDGVAVFEIESAPVTRSE